MTGGATFRDIGEAIWSDVRKRDRIGIDMLAYFEDRTKDRAFIVMWDSFGMTDEASGTYHCLCGLGLLEPYIDNDGVECARLTPLGRQILSVKGESA